MVFAPDWSVLHRAARGYSATRDVDGAVTLDVAALLASVEALVAECAAAAPIEALAVTAIGEAIVPVDERGRPLADAMLTADARLRGSGAAWTGTIGADRVHRLTGLPLRDAWSGNAMRHHLAAPYGSRIAGFRTIDDVVAGRLGNAQDMTPRMALSHASRTMLLERATASWSRDLLDASGVPAALLPEIAMPGETLGRMAAPGFGLAKGTRIVCAGHDQHVAAIGAGASPMRPLWASGTVEAVTRLRTPPGDAPMVGVDYKVTRDASVRPAANLNGGQALAWLRSLLAQNGFDALDDAPRADDPIVVPTLGTTGAPDFRTDVSATIVGLRYATDHATLLRVMAEGITMETRRAVLGSGHDVDDVDAFVLAGGGTRSDGWNRLRAAAFDRPVIRRRHADCGCVGAAMLARAALGDAATDVERANPVLTVSRPDADLRERFLRRAERYEELRQISMSATAAAA